MATVNGYTAEHMLAIADSVVVDGNVVGDNLILTTQGGDPIDAGNVRGPAGSTGSNGATGAAGLDAAFLARASDPSANLTLSGTQTIDGVALAVGDIVLAKNQTSAQNNGLWVVASGAWTRPANADSSAEIAGAIVRVREGTQHGGTRWVTSFKTTDTFGTTAMNWFRSLDGFNSAYVTMSGGNTDSSGFITVNHNLGWSPRMVFGMQANPSTRFAMLWGVDTITTTSFRARMMNASTAGALNVLDIGSFVFLCIR